MLHREGERATALNELLRPREAVQRWAVQPKPVKCQTTKMFWGIFGYNICSNRTAMDGDADSKRGGVTARVYKGLLEKEMYLTSSATRCLVGCRLSLMRIDGIQNINPTHIFTKCLNF